MAARTLFINRFKHGSWLDKSNSILNNKSKLTQLLGKLTKYLQRDGLQKCKDDLLLIGDYINDVIRGKYTDFSKSSLTLAVAAIIYVVSPLDLMPDMIPAGLVDDASIVLWAISQLNEELSRYSAFKKDKDGKNPSDREPESLSDQ